MQSAHAHDERLFLKEPGANASSQQTAHCYTQVPLRPVSPTRCIGLRQHAPTVSTECDDQFVSLAQFYPDNDAIENSHLFAKTEKIDANLNLFVDASIFQEMRTALRSWMNLFTVAEITAPAAEYSMFSPRCAPFCSKMRARSALLSQPQLPGLSCSSTKSTGMPPYYPTPAATSAWARDATPNAVGAFVECDTSNSFEEYRKRSRELNFVTELNEAQDCGKQPRIGRAECERRAHNRAHARP
jgi:hypothetical protein